MLKVKSWHFPTDRVQPQSPSPAVAHGSPTQYIASNCQGCAELRDGVPPPWLCSGTAVSHPTSALLQCEHHGVGAGALDPLPPKLYGGASGDKMMAIHVVGSAVLHGGQEKVLPW